MSLPAITPAEAQRLVAEGALLIDIRGRDEHARVRIPGAMNLPLDGLGAIDGGGRQIVFHCKSGQRTVANSSRLKDAVACDAYIVAGGIDAWRRAGLPVAVDRGQPIEIMRQVQIVAGSLVLAGVVLGQLVAPELYALSAFVGAGLTFAGLSGWCGMARLLALMPWNRRVAAADGAVARQA